ncbi:MAG: hypothetical protein KA140_03815 [Caldisericia bacterium]|nr:hypothetical protein [Caldisericia bacterium]
MAKNLKKTASPVAHEAVASKSMFEKLFGMPASAVNWGREILAGLTGLLGTAFILFAWSKTLGTQFEPNSGGFTHVLMIGTLLAMIVSNLAQSFWAKLPYIVTPSIGTLMLMIPLLGIATNFNVLMALFLLEGIIFLTMSFLPYTKKIITAIPQPVKHGIVLTVGLMLIFMGLSFTCLFSGPSAVGNLTTAKFESIARLNGLPGLSVKWLLDARTLVMIFGLAVVGYFTWTKNKATFVITMIMTAAFGLLFFSNQQQGLEYSRVTPIIFVDYANSGNFMVPFSSWASTYLLKPNFADLFGKIGSSFGIILSTFLVMLAKDTLGTASSMIALGKQSGDMTENDENHHRTEKAMQVVGFNRIVTGLVGGVPADIAPEASIAVEADGRTSVTPFIYAIGCVVLLFGFNFFAMIPAIAVAPILVVIGAGMLRGIGKIHWRDPLEAIPTAVMMFVAAITFNLFVAVALGMAINMIIRVVIWKFDDTPGGFWLLGSLSLASLIFFFASVLG